MNRCGWSRNFVNSIFCRPGSARPTSRRGTRIRVRTRRRNERMANGEWRIGMNLERCRDQFLSGLAGMAGCHVAGRELLSSDTKLSQGRDVRINIANPPFGSFHSGQHRGGAWPRAHADIRTISSDFSGLVEGTRNAFVARGTRRCLQPSEHRVAPGTMSGYRKNAPRAYSKLAGEELASVTPSSAPYSPFATRHSPIHLLQENA